MIASSADLLKQWPGEEGDGDQAFCTGWHWKIRRRRRGRWVRRMERIRRWRVRRRVENWERRRRKRQIETLERARVRKTCVLGDGGG